MVDGICPLSSPLTMIRYRAAWIVPIAGRPIKNGWVDVDDGIVTNVGSPESDRPGTSLGHVDLNEHVILPGLVNAHTHLELSGFRNQIPTTRSMPDWTRRLLDCMSDTLPSGTAIRAALVEAKRAGTALVGDISNTLTSVDPLRDAGIASVVFKELLGFDERRPTEVVSRLCADLAEYHEKSPRLRLAAHAPYSVSPGLFAALRAEAEKQGVGPLSVHVAESVEELEFLGYGTGAWREILEERGRWDPSWRPPAVSPVEYLASLGWLASDTLMVHGVQLTDSELVRMASAGTTLVTCPRSNQWTGAGCPPIDRFYASGVRVAVGTDSLASVVDLNVFAEIHEIRRLGPSVPAADILRSATWSGAEALGFGSELGVIAPGYRAALVAVHYPEQLDDVEEYLVSGIQPEQVRWLDGPIS